MSSFKKRSNFDRVYDLSPNQVCQPYKFANYVVRSSMRVGWVSLGWVRLSKVTNYEFIELRTRSSLSIER